MGKRSQNNPFLPLRRAQSTAGLAWFIKEAGRNSILHGQASRVDIDLKRLGATDGEPSLICLDNGLGMDEEARDLCGCEFGWSPVSNGIGVREAAVTVAQRLEFQTVYKSEPNIVHSITIPTVKFIVDVNRALWKGKWQSSARNRGELFPKEYSHGTLVILSDFRNVDFSDPGLADIAQDVIGPISEETIKRIKMKSTAHLISEERIRAIVAKELYDLARFFVVNGKRIDSLKLDGYPLWDQKKPVEKPGLGQVSGDIRLSESGAGNLLVIGGTTATVPITNFLAGFFAHNPDLAAKIPLVFSHEKRLTGYMRMRVLEKYPTTDRMQLLSSFYTSSEAHMVVEEMVRVGAKIDAKIEECNSRLPSKVTKGFIDEVVARLHDAQGVHLTFEKKEGQAGVVGGAIADEDKAAPVSRLQVSSNLIHLEPWDGGENRDSAKVQVLNPLPGEEFEWNDRGMGLLANRSGREAVIQAVKISGGRGSVFLVDVVSKSNPAGRRTTITVDIRFKKTGKALSDDDFCLMPLATTVEVGQKRFIRVKHQGNSSGFYGWMLKSDQAVKDVGAHIEIQSGNMGVMFSAKRPGVYVIECEDKRNKGLVARSKIEARARRIIEDDTPSAPVPPASGVEKIVVSAGGDGAVLVQPPTGSTILILKHNGHCRQIEVRPDAHLAEPWLIQPDRGLLAVSDRFLGLFDDTSAQRRHVLCCIVEGAAALFRRDGVLSAEDYVGEAQFIGEITRMFMAKKPDENKGKK